MMEAENGEGGVGKRQDAPRRMERRGCSESSQGSSPPKSPKILDHGKLKR